MTTLLRVTRYAGGEHREYRMLAVCPRCTHEWDTTVRVTEEPRTHDYPGYAGVRIIADGTCPRCGRELEEHELDHELSHPEE